MGQFLEGRGNVEGSSCDGGQHDLVKHQDETAVN